MTHNPNNGNCPKTIVGDCGYEKCNPDVHPCTCEEKPCDCPKGGVYSDGTICGKCDGVEYIPVLSESEKTAKSFHDPCPYGNDECTKCQKEKHNKIGSLCTQSYCPEAHDPTPTSVTGEEWVEEFREEYRKAYAGILPEEVLAQGNPWFENFIRSTLLSHATHQRQQIAGEMKNRYGKDGGPALVVIESHEGGVSQRPALDDVLEIINRKV